MLPPSTEVLLSYLQGLGKPGTMIEPRTEWAVRDLGYCQKTSVYVHLKRLIKARCIKKIAGGANGTLGWLVVLKRLEDIEHRTVERIIRAPDDPAVAKVAGVFTSYQRDVRTDWMARIAEIPNDTRGLTARVCGDPLPGRSALDRRHACPA